MSWQNRSIPAPQLRTCSHLKRTQDLGVVPPGKVQATHLCSSVVLWLVFQMRWPVSPVVAALTMEGAFRGCLCWAFHLSIPNCLPLPGVTEDSRTHAPWVLSWRHTFYFRGLPHWHRRSAGVKISTFSASKKKSFISFFFLNLWS